MRLPKQGVEVGSGHPGCQVPVLHTAVCTGGEEPAAMQQAVAHTPRSMGLYVGMGWVERHGTSATDGPVRVNGWKDVERVQLML